MNKEYYLNLADNDAREMALAFRPCIAYYSPTHYINSLAYKRYDAWLLDLEYKEIEIPKNYATKVRTAFITTFKNVLLDHLDYLKKHQPKNPYVEDALKKDAKKNK